MLALGEALLSRRVRLALSRVNPEKATIKNLDKSWPNNKIEVSFNPETITYTTCPVYHQVEAPDAPNGVRLNYAGANATKISMKLLFDTTINGKDVRKEYINFLIELTIPVKTDRTSAAEPPLCRFWWGKFSAEPYLTFAAVVKDLSVNYTMFLANGRPIRAEVDMTFMAPDETQYGTNPTSRSEARRVWQVVEGQTLDWIAYKEYGDSSAWRHIARVNNLRNPRDLRPGMVLKLVPLP